MDKEKDLKDIENDSQKADINTDGVKEPNKEGSKKSKKSKKTSKAKKVEEELKTQLEEKNIQFAELNDKYLRLYSEFDNFRKRTIKEKAELYKNAAEDTILAILPTIDDFERALQHFDTSDEAKAHKEGMELIYNKLLSTLKGKGVESIGEKEVDFDTDIHEAITKIPAPSDELKGKVVDIVEKGYKLNDKIIRFAKVVVGE